MWECKKFVTAVFFCIISAYFVCNCVGSDVDCNLQCENGGILFTRYCHCRCVDGYRGPNCTEPPCDASLCENGYQNPWTCECRCRRGWSGPRCECSRYCRNGGTLSGTTCTCACANGYRGDSCGLQPCNRECNNGTINETNCKCECLEGWSGRNCDCDLQCENGGILHPYRCECDCQNGYRGPTCNLEPCNAPCEHGWVDQTDCQCNCNLGWSGDGCNCGRVCDNGGVLNVDQCSCTCTGGFKGPNCRRCRVRCTEPEVLSPKTCQCVVPTPCDMTLPCAEGLNRCSRSCLCIPPWVNCGQFDIANCRMVVDGGFCGSLSNQASCPHACGLCESDYFLNQLQASNVYDESIRSIDNLYNFVCGKTPFVEHSEVFVNSSTFMSVAVYMCIDGYTPVGTPLTQCQEDCTWLPMNFTCTAIRKRDAPGCGNPPLIRDMSVAFATTSIDSLAEYRCRPGFQQTGSGKARCQPNELWSIPALSCKAIQKRSISECGPPPNITGMVVKFTTTVMGSTIEYTCLQGYLPTGSGKAICRPNTQWSTPSLSCKSKNVYCLYK